MNFLPGRSGPTMLKRFSGFWRIRDHGIRPDRETPDGIPLAQKQEMSMSQNIFPDGWDEEKVQQVLAHMSNRPKMRR
jgi:hypothetical protein